MNHSLKDAWNGIGAGIVLGIWLKFAQSLSDEAVYTLLLTVDYVPVLNRLDWPEWPAFALHLIIAAIVGIVWGVVCRAARLQVKSIRILSIIVGLVIGIMLLPTTYLSQLTPDTITAPFAFWWLVGHLIFGLVLGLLQTRTRKLV
jgi:hypothetical protein